MSKIGKVGVIVFFLFSIGAVISAFKLIGNIEEGQKKIEGLNITLQEKSSALVKIEEENATLKKEIEKERGLKEEIQRELNRKITNILKEAEKDKAEKIAWKNKFEDLKKTRTELENKYKEAQQAILNLREMLRESSPNIRANKVVKVPQQPSILPKEMIGGRVLVVAKPFLSLALDRDVVSGLHPVLSIYRKGELVRELDTKGIQYVTFIAGVSPGESSLLEGIKKNDRVTLNLLPGATGIFGSTFMKGEVLDVISQGFLNIDLGKEGLGNIEPVLSVYRDNKLFKKIVLKNIDHLTVVVEAGAGTKVKGIRKKDMVKFTP